jgi:hypothetical protein
VQRPENSWEEFRVLKLKRNNAFVRAGENSVEEFAEKKEGKV